MEKKVIRAALLGSWYSRYRCLQGITEAEEERHDPEAWKSRSRSSKILVRNLEKAAAKVDDPADPDQQLG